MNHTQETISLLSAKLNSSGLTLTDAHDLGIVPLEKNDLKDLFPSLDPPVRAMKIPYFDPDKKIKSGIFRVRLLEKQILPFGAESKTRYLQAPGSLPSVYFPSIVDWPSIIKDSKQDLIITEGELKAACACKNGLFTVGLGGVYSWKSKKLNWEFLPDLDAIAWHRRSVSICYDSDAVSNPQVSKASFLLASALVKRGALVKIVNLPSIDGSKVGLDDFILSHGIDDLKSLIAAAPCDELSLLLHDANSRYCYIKRPDGIYDEIDHDFINPRVSTKNGWFANKKTKKIVGAQQDGSPKVKDVYLMQEWMEWEHRRGYKGFKYEPGKPQDFDGFYNQWSGFAVEPKEGDVSLWHGLLDYLFKDSEKEARVWFERWLAYPLQHVGTKMLTACCLYSNQGGVGKSFVGYFMSKIYGENFTEIPQTEFSSNFNGYLVNKQFAMVDDVTSSSVRDGKEYAAKLKTLVTQKSFKANEKYTPQYMITDCINYLLTTNSPDALHIDMQDRRYFILHCPEEKMPQYRYDELNAWIHTEECGQALFHYFLNLDLGDQKFNTPPPITAAKEDMTDLSRNDAEIWVNRLINDPDGVLKIGRISIVSDLLTSSYLFRVFKATSSDNWTSQKAFGTALRSMKLFPRSVRCGGTVHRLIAIRNIEKWSNASPKEWADHFSKNNPEA